MTVQREEPDLLVAFCDGCGERRILDDIEQDAEKDEIAAALAAIYDMIMPERREGRSHWKEKVRQILQLYHRPIERGRWAL